MTDRTVSWMQWESLVLPWGVWQTVCLLEKLPAVVNSCLIDNSSVARLMEIRRHSHLLNISSCESLGFKKQASKQKILISITRCKALWGKSEEGQKTYLKEYSFGGITSVKKIQSKYPSKRSTKMTGQPNKRLEHVQHSCTPCTWGAPLPPLPLIIHGQAPQRKMVAPRTLL